MYQDKRLALLTTKGCEVLKLSAAHNPYKLLLPRHALHQFYVIVTLLYIIIYVGFQLRWIRAWVNWYCGKNLVFYNQKSGAVGVKHANSCKKERYITKTLRIWVKVYTPMDTKQINKIFFDYFVWKVNQQTFHWLLCLIILKFIFINIFKIFSLTDNNDIIKNIFFFLLCLAFLCASLCIMTRTVTPQMCRLGPQWTMVVSSSVQASLLIYKCCCFCSQQTVTT